MCHLLALIIQALRVSIPALIVAIFIGTEAVQNMLNAIPQWLSGGLGVAGGFIVVVGYAMVINMMEAKYLMPFLFLGFVVAAFTDFNLIALGVLGTVAAIVYIQLNPKYNKSKTVTVVSNTDNDDLLD